VLSADGILAFGPSRLGAQLEASKIFTKRFAERHGILTAPYRVFGEAADAERFVASHPRPVVVKADGLWGGKGVTVAAGKAEAVTAIRRLLDGGLYASAERPIVVEDRLEGVELSAFAICDGTTSWTLPLVHDYKRVGEGDVGPNTGGMGAYAPIDVEPDLLDCIEHTIIGPTVRGMAAEGIPFRGVLYAGLMVDQARRPWLLEYNVRFGDPECQALLPLLDGDLAELLASAARGSLERRHVVVNASRRSVVVVLATEGYPAAPKLGAVVAGLDTAADDPRFPNAGAAVFHAGTRRRADAIVTAGGRVLAVTGTGRSFAEARDAAYRRAGELTFDGMQRRSDIALAAGPS
jgi:phosphoribosylamine--glycine ligase